MMKSKTISLIIAWHFCFLGNIGCQNQLASQTSFAQGNTVTLSSAQSIDAYASVAGSDALNSSVSQLSAQKFSDFYLSLTAQAASTPNVQIDGHLYDNMQDRTTALQDQYAQLNANYPTVADYWNDIGFDPSQPITAADVEAALNLLDAYQAIPVNDIQGWMQNNDTLAQTLFSSASQAQVAKLLVVMTGAAITQQQQNSSQLALSTQSTGTINHSGTATNPLFPPVGQGPAITRGSYDNNVCSGSNSIAQNGDGSTVGPTGTTRVTTNDAQTGTLSGGWDTSSPRCAVTPPTPEGYSKFDNNIMGGNGAIVQNGENNHVGG